ncbi:hypothetical protein FHG87_016456 [Trinorchestia longiramus]|nr:hypothetical protein FHG87_016456 [Trinorchestia longiramus]
MNTNFLLQHVNEPTTQNNILDLVMTTPDLRIIGLELTDMISDHHMIDFALEVHGPHTRTRYKNIFSHAPINFELMKEELGSFHYEAVMRNNNAKECYLILKGKNATATEHHIQTKRM